MQLLFISLALSCPLYIPRGLTERTFDRREILSLVCQKPHPHQFMLTEPDGSKWQQPGLERTSTRSRDCFWTPSRYNIKHFIFDRCSPTHACSLASSTTIVVLNSRRSFHRLPSGISTFVWRFVPGYRKPDESDEFLARLFKPISAIRMESGHSQTSGSISMDSRWIRPSSLSLSLFPLSSLSLFLQVNVSLEFAKVSSSRSSIIFRFFASSSHRPTRCFG